ncbi:MAG: helix-turn-helix transcriptional regulator [Leptospiraceae bacterium]|nr:helix-turn-helix transcriptional regulator [Leptospiraceae bacterium]MCP5495123.1 helix-turn-helix transcriptional regulator [Leptospiraceae bacterium]
MIISKEELEKEVRKGMKNSGKSIYQLAEETEISKTHIHGIITETQKPSLEILMRIADVLKINFCFSNARETMDNFIKRKSK